MNNRVNQSGEEWMYALTKDDVALRNNDRLSIVGSK